MAAIFNRWITSEDDRGEVRTKGSHKSSRPRKHYEVRCVDIGGRRGVKRSEARGRAAFNATAAASGTVQVTSLTAYFESLRRDEVPARLIPHSRHRRERQDRQVAGGRPLMKLYCAVGACCAPPRSCSLVTRRMVTDMRTWGPLEAGRASIQAWTVSATAMPTTFAEGWLSFSAGIQVTVASGVWGVSLK